VGTLKVPEPRVPGVSPVLPVGADRQGVDVEGKPLVIALDTGIVPLDNQERLPVVWTVSAESLEPEWIVERKRGGGGLADRTHAATTCRVPCYQTAGRLLP
jgi:hypothetical protein